MRFLKLAAAFAMMAGVVTMTPQPSCAALDACGQCGADCTDAWEADTSPNRDARYSDCLNSCVDDNGWSCQGGPGGG